MGDDTSSYYSCSAQLNGEFYVFGGKVKQTTQVGLNSIILTVRFHKSLKMSKVIGCELTRIGDLGFEFDGGACGTFKFPEERIMLCFAYSGTRKCVRYFYTAIYNMVYWVQIL